MTAVIRRDYADSRLGQIHRRIKPATGSGTPLVCLHPAPFSGIYFETIMPLLDIPGGIIAPDYPGFGGSDRIDGLPSIENFAAAMHDAIDDQTGPVDLLGFHTGCLVAVEMAHSNALETLNTFR